MAFTIEQSITQYLIQCAVEQRTTTYEELARTFDLPTAWPQMGNVIGGILYSIYYWCRDRRLPKLTVLVVHKSGEDKGIPGAGFWKAAELEHLIGKGTKNTRATLTTVFTDEVFEYFEIPVTPFVKD